MFTPDQERDIQTKFGNRIREFREAQKISQEELAHKASVDRTYISSLERGLRNVSLLNILAVAKALDISPADLFSTGLKQPARAAFSPSKYKINPLFKKNFGFDVSGSQVLAALAETEIQLAKLPSSLFLSVDLKTVSSIVGAIFAASIASSCGAIVNPIEKGHPDILPKKAKGATEEQLRNYPEGLEIKVTVGNVKQGSDLKPGTPRLPHLSNITWQAHHREVESLMGLVLDFLGNTEGDFRYPVVSAVFYSGDLKFEDWGEISGTTGRNTKVTGMKSSAKRKMGSGWVSYLDNSDLILKYKRILGQD